MTIQQRQKLHQKQKHGNTIQLLKKRLLGKKRVETAGQELHSWHSLASALAAGISKKDEADLKRTKLIKLIVKKMCEKSVDRKLMQHLQTCCLAIFRSNMLAKRMFNNFEDLMDLLIAIENMPVQHTSYKLQQLQNLLIQHIHRELTKKKWKKEVQLIRLAECASCKLLPPALLASTLSIQLTHSIVFHKNLESRYKKFLEVKSEKNEDVSHAKVVSTILDVLERGVLSKDESEKKTYYKYLPLFLRDFLTAYKDFPQGLGFGMFQYLVGMLMKSLGRSSEEFEKCVCHLLSVLQQYNVYDNYYDQHQNTLTQLTSFLLHQPAKSEHWYRSMQSLLLLDDLCIDGQIQAVVAESCRPISKLCVEQHQAQDLLLHDLVLVYSKRHQLSVLYEKLCVHASTTDCNSWPPVIINKLAECVVALPSQLMLQTWKILLAQFRGDPLTSSLLLQLFSHFMENINLEETENSKIISFLEKTKHAVIDPLLKQDSTLQASELLLIKSWIGLHRKLTGSSSIIPDIPSTALHTIYQAVSATGNKEDIHVAAQILKEMAMFQVDKMMDRQQITGDYIDRVEPWLQQSTSIEGVLLELKALLLETLSPAHVDKLTGLLLEHIISQTNSGCGEEELVMFMEEASICVRNSLIKHCWTKLANMTDLQSKGKKRKTSSCSSTSFISLLSKLSESIDVDANIYAMLLQLLEMPTTVKLTSSTVKVILNIVRVVHVTVAPTSLFIGCLAVLSQLDGDDDSLVDAYELVGLVAQRMDTNDIDMGRLLCWIIAFQAKMSRNEQVSQRFPALVIHMLKPAAKSAALSLDTFITKLTVVMKEDLTKKTPEQDATLQIFVLCLQYFAKRSTFGRGNAGRVYDQLLPYFSELTNNSDELQTLLILYPQLYHAITTLLNVTITSKRKKRSLRDEDDGSELLCIHTDAHILTLIKQVSQWCQQQIKTLSIGCTSPIEFVITLARHYSCVATHLPADTLRNYFTALFSLLKKQIQQSTQFEETTTEVQDAVEKCLSSIIAALSTEKILYYLEDIQSNALRRGGDALLATIRLWTRLLDEKLKPDQLNTVVSCCQILVRELSGVLSEDVKKSTLVLAMITLYAKMLHHGTDLLSWSSVLKCVECMQFLTSDKCATGMSPQLCEALYNMLNEVLLYHSDTVVRNSEGTFARILASYLIAVMTQCVEKQHHAAALIHRLVIHMVQHHRVDFAKVAPNLIADYVCTAQSVMLTQEVKEKLVLVVHSLLSICDHHAIRKLRAALPGGEASRQLFTDIYEEYEKNKQNKGDI